MPLHPHVATVLIAATVAAVMGAWTARIAGSGKLPVTVVANPTTSAKTISRLAAASWGELQQSEVDKLTALLKMESSKTPVIILCQDDAKCGDMALDFENAFESARWTVEQERPLADATVGIGITSASLGKLIEIATDGRLKPVPITANMKDKIALVIGKKPK